MEDIRSRKAERGGVPYRNSLRRKEYTDLMLLSAPFQGAPVAFEDWDP